VTVDRLARHAALYGVAGVFPAAREVVADRDLGRLASILRRLGWRPSKSEQKIIDAARSNGGRPPISEFCSTAGWSLADPHGKRARSVAGGKLDPRRGPPRECRAQRCNLPGLRTGAEGQARNRPLLHLDLPKSCLSTEPEGRVTAATPAGPIPRGSRLPCRRRTALDFVMTQFPRHLWELPDDIWREESWLFQRRAA
jgi:hypothetical protein